MCKHRAAAVSICLCKSLGTHILENTYKNSYYIIKNISFAFPLRSGWSLFVRSNVQHLLSASSHDPAFLLQQSIPSSWQRALFLIHTEVLKKVPLSYPCFYYMNSCGTREVSTVICRPAVTSRSDKRSELWHLEHKTESVWGRTSISKWGYGLM